MTFVNIKNELKHGKKRVSSTNLKIRPKVRITSGCYFRSIQIWKSLHLLITTGFAVIFNTAIIVFCFIK